MNKQLVLRQIEVDLEHNHALQQGCSALVDFISRHRPEELLQITFGLIGYAAKVKMEEAIPIAHYFLGPSNHLLDKRFLFSYSDEDYEIEPDVLAEARRSMIFYHPDTGEEVWNYEEYIFLYFVLSDAGVRLAGECL
ncbi:hypothetical protein [Delftia acidovorans]|uniref:hypothetical protein n=1 Tax=Delftia acidovorans TaxID=80866 RepID=UPI00192B8802|nr:hypothetical protein [Delftia acidovorans]